VPDVEKPDAETPTERGRATGEKARKAASTLRSKLASLVWLVAVVCALFLATGALLVTLRANPDNPAVKFILDAADTLDLGIFSTNGEGIFDLRPEREKSALVNWGLAAVGYLVVGKILDRVIRP